MIFRSVGMECGGMTPLSQAATCRGKTKRRHVAALQSDM